MKIFSNRTIVISGASRGMGRAFAIQLAEEGASLVLLGRNETELNRTQQMISETGAHSVVYTLDLTNNSSIAECGKKIRKNHENIYGLINCAGVSGQNYMNEPDNGVWDSVITTNLTGTYHLTKELLPNISDGGKIVNVSSVLGKFGVPGYAAYCTSKHGVIGFTRTLALELASRKISANAICPGWVNTEMSQQGIQFAANEMNITPQEFWKIASQNIPLKDIIEPEEIAHLVSFILHPKTKNLTGQAITYDGGQVMY